MACIPYTLAWILICFATNVWLIYLARAMVGIGSALFTTTVYNVEVPTRELRGSLVTFETVLK